MNQLETAVQAGAILGEGPSWDTKQELLYWVDIEGYAVHVYDPATGEDRCIPVGDYVGAVVPRESGGVAVVLRDGYHLLDIQSGKLTALKEAVEPGDLTRFNDGKCDPAGRFWAGTMSLKGEDNQGSLYVMDTQHNVKQVLSPVSTSNGLCWSGDGRTFYYIDTASRCVMAYDYDGADGQISNPRKAVDFPENEGYPDGMTIDAEGMLWVAHWDGWKVSRFNPANGERIAEIAMPVAKVTSCVFGGAELDELYITTASSGLNAEERAQQPQAGHLFRIKPGVKGAPTYAFKG